MPNTAAAALSKIVLEISFKPKMSTMECIVIMSVVPTNGANSCLPEAIGEITIFGAPIGNAINAAAVITPPSAPPKPIPPITSLLATISVTFLTTNSRINSTAAPREPAFCTFSIVVPPYWASAALEKSGVIPIGSPNIPTSMT